MMAVLLLTIVAVCDGGCVVADDGIGIAETCGCDNEPNNDEISYTLTFDSRW